MEELIKENQPSIPKIDLMNKTSNAHHRDQNNRKDVSHFTISSNLHHSLWTNPVSHFEQRLTIHNAAVVIRFEKVDILSSNFHTITSDGIVSYPDLSKMHFYRGTLIGQKDAWATLMITDHEVRYLIASKSGNYEIHPSDEGDYLGYYAAEIPKNSFKCQNEDENFLPVRQAKNNSGSRYGQCLEIYLECDYFTRQTLGSDINTTNWATALFNNVAAVFAQSNIPIVLSQLFIWTSPDPYASITNIGSVRDQFVNTRQNNYNGRIAHLLSMRPVGGGISNGIGGFCNTYPSYPGPQCISTGLTSPNISLPTYSFNTYIVCHELGHVMGLRHSHACTWGNTSMQVDDCGNVYAQNNNQTIEGNSCYNPASPVLPASGGTIMSQCHLINGIGIQLSHGFGPVIGQVLYDNFIFAGCNTGSNCNNLPPVNDLCSNAVQLPINPGCINSTFTNVRATATAGPPPFSCGNPGTTMKDIWFKVIIPASGKLTISTSQVSGGLTDLIMQAYSGSCLALTTISCHDNISAGNLHASISLTGRTVGETIFIRIVDTQSDQEGLFNICAYDDSMPCHPDFAALISFYQSTGGSQWTNKTGWQAGALSTDCNVCQWYGVTCNVAGRVSTLNLSSNNLVSTSLPSSLATLPYLTTLRLYNNQISGPLPTMLSSMPQLNTLDLGRNSLTGSVPSFLSDIISLKNLYLDHNTLSGPLPASLASLPLSLVYVNDNQLSGCFPVQYSTFCGISTDFNNNPSLSNGIPFDDLCSLGHGVDGDNDGYCNGALDCDDNDPLIHPEGIEICNLKDDNCNGLIDDIVTPQTNTWIGTSGAWDLPDNWSLGVVPARCQDVVITGNIGLIISIPSGVNAVARSVTVASNKTLQILSGAQLMIHHGMNVVNQGTIINSGQLIINNILNNANFGLQNNGTLNNTISGIITIQNSGTRSLSNSSGATLTNLGSIIIDRNAFGNISTGLYNFGTLTNTGSITIRNILGTEVLIPIGGIFINQPSSLLRIE
ncbi:MAG: M12 family metallo-peptidase [Saprospiraceae bacterium]